MTRTEIPDDTRRDDQRQSASAHAHKLTKAQLAQHLQTSERQIELWMRRKVIPFLKLGRRCVRFDLRRVEQALAKYEVRAIGQQD